MDFVSVKRGRQDSLGEYHARKARDVKGLGNTMGININFDMNGILDSVLHSRRERKIDEYVNNCGHIWTLYFHSVYSFCDKCGVPIRTSLILDTMFIGIAPSIVSRVVYGEQYTLPTDRHGYARVYDNAWPRNYNPILGQAWRNSHKALYDEVQAVVDERLPIKA